MRLCHAFHTERPLEVKIIGLERDPVFLSLSSTAAKLTSKSILCEKEVKGGKGGKVALLQA